MNFSAHMKRGFPADLAAALLAAWLCGSSADASTKTPPPPPKIVARAPPPQMMARPMPTPPARPGPMPLQGQGRQFSQPMPLQQPRLIARPMQPMHVQAPMRSAQHSSPGLEQRHAAVQARPERPNTDVAHGTSPGGNAPVENRFARQPSSAQRSSPLAPSSRFVGTPGRPAGGLDPRIGAAMHADGHTHGLERGMAIAAALPPRPFLRAGMQRNMGAERVFLARHAADFHTRMVRDFNAHELGLWRAGVWRNEWHYGRRGWWWEADGGWYDYPQPVFPYPEEVSVPVVLETPVVEGPDVSAQEGLEVAAAPADGAVQQAGAPPRDADIAATDAPGGAPHAPLTAGQAPPAGIPPLPPAPVGWYRCYAPSGVYPGVQDCGMAWELVQNAPLPGEL